MFGIGAGELVLIAIVVLLAVGPDQMPKMIRTVGRGMRQVRQATRELQSTVGIDELLNDEDLRDLRNPMQARPKPQKPSPAPAKDAAARDAIASRRAGLALGDDDYRAEQSELGVDLELAYARAEAAARAEQEQSELGERLEPSVPAPAHRTSPGEPSA